jgi:hypothetical protein
MITVNYYRVYSKLETHSFNELSNTADTVNVLKFNELVNKINKEVSNNLNTRKNSEWIPPRDRDAGLTQSAIIIDNLINSINIVILDNLNYNGNNSQTTIPIIKPVEIAKPIEAPILIPEIVIPPQLNDNNINDTDNPLNGIENTTTGAGKVYIPDDKKTTVVNDTSLTAEQDIEIKKIQDAMAGVDTSGINVARENLTQEELEAYAKKVRNQRLIGIAIAIIILMNIK